VEHGLKAYQRTYVNGFAILVSIISLYLVVTNSFGYENTATAQTFQLSGINDTLHVSGEATTHIIPDTVTVSLERETTDKNAEVALNNNSKLTNNMSNALKSAGVKEDSMTKQKEQVDNVDDNKNNDNNDVIENDKKQKQTLGETIPFSPVGCPPGYHKDPDSQLCVAESNSNQSQSSSSSFLRAPSNRGTLVVYVKVINDQGGTKQPSDFTVSIPASPSRFVGLQDRGVKVSIDSGVNFAIIAGPTYPDSRIGYQATFSNGCSGQFTGTELRPCTITFDDWLVPPPVDFGPCSDNANIRHITASGVDGNNIPWNVRDGNFGTRWSSEGIGQWIRTDLDYTESICGVEIAWYKGNERVNNFVVSTSTDGVTFTNVYSGSSSGTTLSYEKYTFTNVMNARYVKITVLGNSINDWASITELLISK